MLNYPMALETCDDLLGFNMNDFRATMYKGFLYEDLKQMDSAMIYYGRALKILDNPNFFKSENIAKDREKIILTGLLKDTFNFKRSVTNFNIKYDTSRFFKYYSDEFINFDRSKYISDF
jgi:hypothetical protein